MGVGGGERGGAVGKSEMVCEDGYVWREAGPAEPNRQREGIRVPVGVTGGFGEEQMGADIGSTLAAVLNRRLYHPVSDVGRLVQVISCGAGKRGWILNIF